MYMNKIVITAQTLIGDTDLYVSLKSADPTINNHDYMSRQIDSTNQIVLEKSMGISFNKPIFFSLFGNVKSEVRIKFEYTMETLYNEFLERAIPITEAVPINEKLLNEEDERLYKYTPWWSAREDRQIIMLADVIYNKVFFYTQWETYPKHFYTTLHD